MSDQINPELMSIENVQSIRSPYRLSLLDRSPIAEDSSAADAFQFSIALARRAEELGFSRFWVAEHHGSQRLASSAPEVLIAHILARTSSIRVGAGGVLLQHYSPFKVAEVFKVLAALAPGRVDLGIGKAPGGMPSTTKALQWCHDPVRKPTFENQLAQLDEYLVDNNSTDWEFSGASAMPSVSVPPARILLGGSPESATLAARQGWSYCHAGHFNGDLSTLERSLQAFREKTTHAPMLALHAVVADNGEEAERLAGGLRMFRLASKDGLRINLVSYDAAVEFATQHKIAKYEIDELCPLIVKGTPEDVKLQLSELGQRFGISEFVFDSPVTSYRERMRSVELLACAFKSGRATLVG